MISAWASELRRQIGPDGEGYLAIQVAEIDEMSPEDHRATAVRCLAASALVRSDLAATVLQAAQVHATLALSGQADRPIPEPGTVQRIRAIADEITRRLSDDTRDRQLIAEWAADALRDLVDDSYRPKDYVV